MERITFPWFMWLSPLTDYDSVISKLARLILEFDLIRSSLLDLLTWYEFWTKIGDSAISWRWEVRIRWVKRRVKKSCLQQSASALIRDGRAQAAQALFMNHTRDTIWRRIIRVCMGFSTRYPWRSLKVKIFNKNGLSYSISVLFAPGVVILPI